MVLKVFCRDANDKGHEWEQFIGIYRCLKDGISTNDPVYLLYNFKIDIWECVNYEEDVPK